MDWNTLLTLSFAGLAASMGVVVFAVVQVFRYQSWLPKQETVETLEALKLQLEERREEWERLNSNAAMARGDIEHAQEARDQIGELREQVATLESRKRELDEVLAKLAGASSELEELAGRIAVQKYELIPELEYRSMLERQKKLDDELPKLESRKRLLDEALELETRKFNEVREQLVAHSRELEELEKRVAVQKQELLPDAEYQYLLERQRDMNEALPTLESRKLQLDQAIVGLEADHERIRDELDLLLPKKEELEEALANQRTERAAIRAEVAGLEQSKTSLEKQINSLCETKAAIGGPGAEQDSDHATELLWQPVLQRGDFAGSGPEDQDEESVLANVRARIEAQNFVYHERVIKAFHTSLKCAQDAPLTVLAGISGTGKSALPTRYAEAIGMHLQTVPVQPGWDSPADLLGFYNHLERRYRPTELMRALIQMDYAHGAAGAGASSGGLGSWPAQASRRTELPDRMLLVLLDEMNLARVEYYFSEFLSRLELRRGVDERKEVDRRRSELVLDLGAAGLDVSQELRVFVGRNVLFVGTMNEDESTQTLSEKVIDRSNVMRFGRPKQLHIEKGNHVNPLSEPNALLRKTWSQWIERATIGDDDARRVDGWIETLNDALSKIGKPFAYRVSDAIRSYARLYPGNSFRDLQDAIADQVELRILPRLRGLDLHDDTVRSSVDSVRRLVADELQDDLLAAALDQAQSAAGDQLFQWSGLDRTQVEARVVF